MSERRTFDIALTQPRGIVTTGQYTCEDGEPPAVGDIIPVDEYGIRARVTNVTPDEYPPIRAQLLEQPLGHDTVRPESLERVRSLGLS